MMLFQLLRRTTASALTSQNPTKCLAFNRSISFFKQQDAETLWKANTTVSNQGRQRGRAKGLVRRKDLNASQKLGFGKARLSWPGLNASLFAEQERGKRKLSKITEMSEEKFTQYEQSARSEPFLRRRRRTPALLRGWSGGSPQGMYLGPPTSKSVDQKFENFESILLEYKAVNHMVRGIGRRRMMSKLIVVGNRNGTAGFALTKSVAFTGVGNPYQKAIDRAGRKCMTINRYEDRTVFHDFFTQFGATKIFVKQQPPGTGIIAHRIIRAICDLVGIKDLYAKIEGAKNPQHITRAFFLGLLRQRTHQALANEKSLHLVEFRPENDNFPRLIASPEVGHVRTKDEILPNEILDFEMIAFEGHLPYYRPKKKPFYTRLPSYEYVVRRNMPFKHVKKQFIQMMVDHGEIKSHFTGIYPECVPAKLKKRKAVATDDDE